MLCNASFWRKDSKLFSISENHARHCPVISPLPSIVCSVCILQIPFTALFRFRPHVPRFVVLEHDYPDVHWDLMLESVAESDEALATWSLAPQPLSPGGFRCPAKRLPDHRKRYLDYEGEVAGSRGSVRRVDAGTFDRLDERRFLLHGTVFAGVLEFKADGGIHFLPNPYSTPSSLPITRMPSATAGDAVILPDVS